MASGPRNDRRPPWETSVEKFESLIVGLLTFFLILIITIIAALSVYLFFGKVGTVLDEISSIADLQQAAVRAFSGVLLVLLGLELLDTVKIYFHEHVVRVEVILLVALIAMGRHVLEIDLHNIDPLILLGFSVLVLALAASYFLVKRAQFSPIGLKREDREK